jgi:hypothetical protein
VSLKPGLKGGVHGTIDRNCCEGKIDLSSMCPQHFDNSVNIASGSNPPTTLPMNRRSHELPQPILNQFLSRLERNKGWMDHPGGNDKADVIVVFEKIQNPPGYKPSTFRANDVRDHRARVK